MIDINNKLYTIAEALEEKLFKTFRGFEKTSEENTKRILSAFQQHRVSDSMFAGTSGYGYDDKGREALELIYADVFGTQSALVRIGFVNGTHAISTALFSALSPGDTMLSVTGTPYDTLRETIGIGSCGHGSLKFYGVGYDEISLLTDGTPDYEGIRTRLLSGGISCVFIQRSRGYSTRRALSVSEIGRIIETVKSVHSEITVIVDNCYGEFTETREPSHMGADIIAGSLIKNPGGGLAPTGGYVAGNTDLIERAAARMTTPGIGGECGPTLGTGRMLFQGFFMSPHTVCQALKTAAFAAGMLEELGYESSPGAYDRRSDIIQMISLKTGDNLERFCRGIQHGSPVDSFLTPEPWQMPGYDCPVIMAAGAFVQGASIELSADGPMREPFPAFLQGGISYESGKLGILIALSEMINNNN